MIQARIVDDAPTIRAYIYRDTPVLKCSIDTTMPVIKGVIQTNASFITGKIVKAIDHEPEPYYEVSNEYGTTIIIGD